MSNRGATLIVVLGILVITITFLGALLGMSGVRMKMAKNFCEQLQSHYAAQAGIETAISHIARGEDDNSFSGAVGEHGRFEVVWEKEGESEDSFIVRAKGIITERTEVKSESDISIKLRKEGNEIFIESWDE